MTEFFRFAVSGFWTFCGVAFLIALMGNAVASCLSAIFHGLKDEDDQ